jgi:hypothetical protein
VGQSDRMDPVSLSNFVQTAEIIEDIEEDASLYGGDPCLGCLQFPDALPFGKKTI